MEEHAPLLRSSRHGPGSDLGPSSAPASVTGRVSGHHLGDHHAQFCHLVGARPINHPRDQGHEPHAHSLYARAVKLRRQQSCTYIFTAALVNTLLLAQVVLGAALTGLGASNSSHILITVLGAFNTIIAGTVAFLKSRGQPLRSRMFRDDLARVVDEIENSAVMWYGISADAHGYGAIDTDDQVTVRGEVARLTRLYDKAVKTNSFNDPDMYSSGPGESFTAGLRKSLGVGIPQFPAPIPVPTPASPPAPTAAPVPPQAQAPTATGQVGEADDGVGGSADKGTAKPSPAAPEASPSTGTDACPSTSRISSSPPPQIAMASSAGAASVADPDASPASAARFPKREDTQSSDKTLVEKGGKSTSSRE